MKRVFSYPLFIVFFLGVLVQSCGNKKDIAKTTITIDSTDVFKPIIKINLNNRQKNLLTKKAGGETVSSLFSINNNVVSSYAVTCEYLLKDDTLLMIPLLPLGNNMPFEIQVYTEHDTIVKRFSIPEFAVKQEAPSVSNIYPLTSSIPTNLLMFHVTFSTPMSEDALAFRDILILDEDGKEKQRVWREKSSWTDDGKHLVLMIHPGRIKKGIRYMDELGVLFEVGKQYTLVIPKHLKDRYGKPLGQEYKKTYTITTMDSTTPVYKHSTPISLQTNSSKAITLNFSEPIDYGTAQLGIKVFDSKDEELAGKVIAISDTEWEFQPTKNWEKGGYKLVLNDYLTDLASNHLTRKFEVTHLDSMKKRQGFKFSFSIK